MSWKPRDAAAYTHGLAARLPVGEIWPRDPAATLMRLVAAVATVVALWAERAGRFLLIEAFPPSSLDLLPDWERVLGLPEPCLPLEDLTIDERQTIVREKLARRPGSQDRYYFLRIADELGYDVTITEHVPAQCGMSQCGYQLRSEADGKLLVRGAGCGTPYIRYVWTITIAGPRLTWFAVGAGGGRAGQDPHLRIRRAEDLECILNKLKPAHTKLVFDYTGV